MLDLIATGYVVRKQERHPDYMTFEKVNYQIIGVEK